MKRQFLLLLSILLTLSCFSQNLHPVKIYNHSKTLGDVNNLKDVYVNFTGKKWDVNSTNCVLQLKDTVGGQVASLVPITSKMDSRDYTYSIDSLNGYNTSDSSILIYFPHTNSGRCMISANYKLYMPTVTAINGALSFQGPSASDSSDNNYDIVYDKFEFTFDTIPSFDTITNTHSTGVFWINTTAVDFFSIPTAIICGSQSTGNIHNLKRDYLISKAAKNVKTYDYSPNKDWNGLSIIADSTIVRFISPGIDPTYLKVYIDTLINYYRNTSHVLYVNCSELNSKGMQIFDEYKVAPAKDPGAYFFKGVVDSIGRWVFINSPNHVDDSIYGKITTIIDLNEANSKDFFAPGQKPFDTKNKTVKSILVKYITAAFTVGMLPASDGDTLQSSYFNKNNFYKENKLTKIAQDRPYYNVYTRAMHDVISSMYAFAYDDVLGQDGTLSTAKRIDTVFVKMGSFGNVKLPLHKDALPVSSVTVVYNSGFQPSSNPDSLTCTVKWTVPSNQPKNAKYFIMLNGKGAGFSISSEDIINAQEGKFFDYNLTVGTLTLAKKDLGTNPTGIWVQVMTAGGKNCSEKLPPSQLLSCTSGSIPIPPSTPIKLGKSKKIRHTKKPCVLNTSKS